jgi:signal transduction histidine kinase
VSNLIINAAKYSVPDSDILISSSIESTENHRQLKFTIQNQINPTGAPDPTFIFDKYYRGAAATKISGSGLGLFLVKELSHALGGEANCHVNQDSIIFTVWIPV